MDDQFQISCQGVQLGVPVLTRDGAQFGLLEHVRALAGPMFRRARWRQE